MEDVNSNDFLVVILVAAISIVILGFIFIYSFTLQPIPSNLNGWQLINHSMSGAQVNVLDEYRDHEKVIHISALEDLDHHVEQLRTVKDLTEGEVRALRFSVIGSEDGKIYYEIIDGENTIWNEINVKTTWRDYTIEYQITMTQTATLTFHLGEYVGEIYFDDIVEGVK